MNGDAVAWEAYGKLAWPRAWIWSHRWLGVHFSRPGPARMTWILGFWTLVVPRWGISPEARLSN